jgi:photosystem II stability/assembly factor-like uncharacterized protein
MLFIAAAARGDGDNRVDFLHLLLDSRPKTAFFASETEESREATSVRQALQWRLATMRDEHGHIPPNARYQANLHRRNGLHGNSGKGNLATQAASISRTSWISRGPLNCGGRTRSLLIDPFDTNVLYAGAVSGGVWKSINAGYSWVPKTDFIANININTMVMDPANHNTIYAGTGEALYGDGLPGSGIFKSTDGGDTWTQLQATQNWQYINRLAMNGSGVLLSSNYDGIWRSTDGGVNWTHVYTPVIPIASVVVFNPNNGNQAAAAGSALVNGYYIVQLIYSGDGGATWSNATTMPAAVDNFAGIDMAWGPSSNVYVNVGVPIVVNNNTFYGEVWRSQDAGATYSRISQQGVTDCTYHCAIWVSPSNASLIVVGGLLNYRSIDGGASFTPINSAISLSNQPHADTHFFVNDPYSPNKLYVCNDGGVYRTNDITTASAGNSWESLNFTYQTSQYYAGAGNAAGIGPLIGGTQDNGTLRVSLLDQYTPAFRPATTANMWSFGGDGGYVAIDPGVPDYIYGEYQYMEIFRSTNGGEANSGFDITSGLPFGTNSHNDFIAPVVMDPNNANVLLAGGGSLWRTTTASAPTPTWSSIRGESNPWFDISAIAVAKGSSNVIWVGEGNGHLQRTANGTASTPTWIEVDNNTPPSLDPLPNRAILRIMIDPADANIVYVAFGGYSVNSPNPQNLWRTLNGGTTWSPINGLPMVPIRSIIRHPRNQRQLYAATDIGIYESDDFGATWSTSQQGPADVSVDELAFVAGRELILAATHGRGLWTADVSSVSTYAPTSVNARASGPGSVGVTWTGVTGATSYQVMRSSDGAGYANAVNGLVSATSYTDTNVVSNKTYLYKVKALVNGSWTDLSAPDLATTLVFTDDNALSGKKILANYLQEIRTAVNAVMTAAGQTPAFGTANIGDKIFATDITDLRSALVSAYTKIGMPSLPTFAERITQNYTFLKGTHYQEIRNFVK